MSTTISIPHKYPLLCFVCTLKHPNTRFFACRFIVHVTSNLPLTVLYVSLCLNGPGVVMVVSSPEYRSSSIEVCSIGALLSSIVNLLCNLLWI